MWQAPPPQSSPVKGEEIRERFAVVVLVTMITLLGGPWQKAHPADTSIAVLSYPDRPAKLPLWLAQDRGLFEKYGLKVNIRAAKSSDDLIEGLKRDEAQIYAATANWIVSAIGDGKDLVFFANTGYSVLKLVARPEIMPGTATARIESRQGCNARAVRQPEYSAPGSATQRRD
jgi:ABC-type nitrate/sulfonate/bicarbonate transport system substrate-binding protein